MNDGSSNNGAPKHEENAADFSVDSLKTGSELVAVMQILRRKRTELTSALSSNLHFYDFLSKVADFINDVEDLEKEGKSGLKHFFESIGSYPALLCSRELHRGLSREFINELKGLSDEHQTGIEICDELNFRVKAGDSISDDEFNTALEGYKNLAKGIKKAVSSEADRLRQTETE